MFRSQIAYLAGACALVAALGALASPSARAGGVAYCVAGEDKLTGDARPGHCPKGTVIIGTQLGR